MREAGYIAQQVAAIPELSWCVSGGGTNEDGAEQPFGLNYQAIDAYHVKATQELDALVTAQGIVIQSLMRRIEALESPV